MPFRRKDSWWTVVATSPWTPVALTAVVIVLLVVVIRLQKEPRSGPPEPSGIKILFPIDHAAMRDSAVAGGRRVLDGYGIRFKSRKQPRPPGETWVVPVPAGKALPSIHLSLQEEMNRIGAEILSAETDPATGKTSLMIGKRDSGYFQIQLVPMIKEEEDNGKLALVIDDFGDKLDDMVYAFFDLDGKITVSVLPGRRYSARVAREASDRGCEVIMHLAMEPLRAAFHGVNNHMGSRATSDRQTMTDVLECVRQKGLYFVDSYTVASSVAYSVAGEMGVPTAKRDVFLDVDGSEEAICRKLGELVLKAKRNGAAVGIGHCHRNMFNALKKEMPRIQGMGMKFVPLSAVVELTQNEGE
jgi:polysaccharide deacetylase 2 family uncharacterized protein YibQ